MVVTDGRESQRENIGRDGPANQIQAVNEDQLEALQKELLERIDPTKELSDDEVRDFIDRLLLEKCRSQYMSLASRCRLGRELFNSIRRLGILQELLDEDAITEIMINGTEAIFIEKNGAVTLWEKRFSSKKKLEDVIQRIVGKTNRRVNEATPIVDTRLENGSRVNVVLSPVAMNGPIVTIRRFPDRRICMEDLLKLGTLSLESAIFLKQLVIAGYNIFISGGTGSGKTTFLNVLSDYIPKDERVITIEDSAELQLNNLPNLVRLEARMEDVEGNNEISIRQLIKTALRMRPNRIVVGEVRGSEAIDMLQAFNTGHDGSLSTGHGNSPKDMLARLEMMVLMGMEIPLQAVRRQIASGIDIIVHLGRIRDKSRKVLEITEVLGYEQGEIQLGTLYSFQDAGTEENCKVKGVLQKTGTLFHCEKLRSAGIVREESDIERVQV